MFLAHFQSGLGEEELTIAKAPLLLTGYPENNRFTSSRLPLWTFKMKVSKSNLNNTKPVVAMTGLTGIEL